MPRVCPNCGTEYRENKVVCPSCGSTHPDAIDTGDGTSSGDSGEERATATSRPVEREGSVNPYLHRMMIVNYALAVLFGGLGGFTLIIRAWGLIGMGLVVLGSGPGDYVVPGGAVRYVLESAGLGGMGIVGGLFSLVVSGVVLAVFCTGFVFLGYAIDRGYQIGLAANLLLYVVTPIVLGLAYGQLLVAVVVMLLLPTTYWPILGRHDVDFGPSLREEVATLIPGLIAELGRFASHYRRASRRL